MQPCHSGGFGPVLTDYQAYYVKCKNRIIQTACAYTEEAHQEYYITPQSLGSLPRGDEFTYYWNAAVRGFYPSPDEPWQSLAKVGFMDFNNYPFNLGTQPGEHPLDYKPDTYDPVTNPFGNNDLIIQMSEAFSYTNNFDT